MPNDSPHPVRPFARPRAWLAGLRRRRDRLHWTLGGIPRFRHADYADLPPDPAAPPPPDRPRDALLIGLQIRFAGPADEPWLARRLMLFGAALRALARRRACVVWFFPHSPAERALPALLRRAGLPLTVIDAVPDDVPDAEIDARYAALDLHLAQSPDSVSLAHDAGTPCLCLDPGGNAAPFAALGLESWCLAEAETNAARLGQRIEDALRDRDRLARHIAARRADRRG